MSRLIKFKRSGFHFTWGFWFPQFDCSPRIKTALSEMTSVFLQPWHQITAHTLLSTTKYACALYKYYQHFGTTSFIWLWFCHFPRLWEAEPSSVFMAVPLLFAVNKQTPWKAHTKKLTESMWTLFTGLILYWNYDILSLVV